MTNDEFMSLSRMLRGRPGAAREGARRVLVDGVPPADAARAAGVTRPAVERVLKRVRELQANGCPVCGRVTLSRCAADPAPVDERVAERLRHVKLGPERGR